jgi:hypothetical protein
MQKVRDAPPLSWASKLNNHKLALAIKFSVIAAVAIVFYLPDLSIVFGNALNDEATFHVLAIPFIFAYLLYRKRNMIHATINQKTQNGVFLQKNATPLAGILLCATAILTYWFGSYTFTPLEYHMLTLPF